jgi:hypothetical protein
MRTVPSQALQADERVICESQRTPMGKRVFGIFMNSALWWLAMNAFYWLAWGGTILVYGIMMGHSDFLGFGMGWAVMGYVYFFGYFFLITPIYHLISGLLAAGDRLTVTNKRVFGKSRSSWIDLPLDRVQVITPFFINKYTERWVWSHAIPHQQAVVSTRPDAKGKQRAYKFWIDDVAGFIAYYNNPGTWKA